MCIPSACYTLQEAAQLLMDAVEAKDERLVRMDAWGMAAVDRAGKAEANYKELLRYRPGGSTTCICLLDLLEGSMSFCHKSADLCCIQGLHSTDQ